MTATAAIASLAGDPGKPEKSEVFHEPASAEGLAATLRLLKDAARKSGPPTYDQRIESLEKLEGSLIRRKDAIAKAIARDFGNRSKHETLIADIFVVLGSIKHTRAHLRDWMEPEDRELSLIHI